MAKTVLEYVQACLSKMDSDLVSDISETEEAAQVAVLLKDVYEELLGRQEWSFLYSPITMFSQGPGKTQFVMPTTTRNLINLWYNIDSAGGYTRRELCYVEPGEFLRRFGGGSAAGNRELITTAANKIQFYIWNDRMPSYYTSFDGTSIYCDAYDASIEANLSLAKVNAFGVVHPTFTVSNSFVPTLPESMVPLLQASLNSSAFLSLKQQASADDERKTSRQLSRERIRENRLNRDHYYSNKFGRK